MQLKLEKNDTVLDLKKQFQSAFPGLKIELFEKAHEAKQSSAAKQRIYGVVALESVVNQDLPCSIDVKETMSVSEVERQFESELGLHVQVFRQMRGVWIETVQTDSYSLAEQMNISKDSVAI